MPHVAAHRVDIVDVLHGHEIADPYRWLEDFAASETQTWLDAQGAAWDAHLAQPDIAARRATFRAELERVVPGVVSPPSFRGERAFFTRRLVGMDHAQLIVREGTGEERVLVDPAILSDDGTITLEGSAASHDGDRILVLLGEAGREEVLLGVLDVTSGDWVERDVLLGRGGDAEWLPGGDELVVVKVAPGTPDDERQFHRRVYRHVVGTDPDTDALLFGDGRDKTTYFGIRTEASGRWLLVSCHLGTAPRNDLYLLDLSTDDPGSSARTVLEGEDAQADARVVDDRLVVWTDRGAPRGRLATARLDAPDADSWTTLIGERDDAVLAGWAPTEHRLVVAWEQHACSALTTHDLASGEPRGEVALPGLGTAQLATRWDRTGDTVWIAYTDDITALTILEHDLTTAATTTWADPPGATPAIGITSELVFVTSGDGTQVPMRVLSRSDAARDGTGTALLTGYGGFQISLTPVYSSLARVWVEAGGVFATACMRGGGEYGQEWHRAGMRANKHHVYEDFEACADWLVDTGWSARDRLAIEGGSNGGLLMGAAITRRPDAYRAVVCENGLLDMIRYELFGLGVTWNDEYGTVERADELAWLLSYSPYHHVTDGDCYPAVLVVASDEDTRVDPMHSRKMVAALQHATSCADEHPILLRREGKVGHGVRAVSRMLDKSADVLAFLADEVALEPFWPGIVTP